MDISDWISFILVVLALFLAFLLWNTREITATIDPIKLHEGAYTWAVFVGNRKETWKLAYISEKEFPFNYSYRGEVEYKDRIYIMRSFSNNALIVDKVLEPETTDKSSSE